MQGLDEAVPQSNRHDRPRGSNPNNKKYNDGSKRIPGSQCNSWHGERERSSAVNSHKPHIDHSNPKEFCPR